MTCREKLALEHAAYIGNEYPGGCRNCPSAYGYLDDPDYCGELDSRGCYECWNREIPETETVENIEEVNETMNNNTVTTKKTKAELLNEITDLKKELENLDKYRQYEQVADELAAMRDALMGKGFTREEAMQFIFNAQKNIRI